MKTFIKTVLIGLSSLSLIACSSTSAQPEVTKISVGKVKNVHLRHVEEKPGLVTVLAGAAVGGLIGNQFGGGSGKNWATGVGAVAGGAITDKALTAEYNQIVYEIHIPRDNEIISIVSDDTRNNIFKNDIVVVYKKGNKSKIDAYGKFTTNKYNLINQKLANGTL